MVIIGPKAASNIVTANARITIVILESVPLRMVQDLRKEAVCIVDDAVDPFMRRRKVADILRKQMVIKQLHSLSIIINYFLAILDNHGRTLQRRHVDEEEVACASVVDTVHQHEVFVHSRAQALLESGIRTWREEQGTPIDVVDADPRCEDAAFACPAQAAAGVSRHLLAVGASVGEQRCKSRLIEVQNLGAVSIWNGGPANCEVIGKSGRCVVVRCQILGPVCSIGRRLIGYQRIS